MKYLNNILLYFELFIPLFLLKLAFAIKTNMPKIKHQIKMEKGKTFRHYVLNRV